MFWREQIEVEALRKNICALRNRQYFHFVFFETTITTPNAEMIRRQPGRFGYSTTRFSPAEAIELEEKLGDLRACPKNMLKVTVFIVPILPPSSGRRIRLRYQGAQNLD